MRLCKNSNNKKQARNLLKLSINYGNTNNNEAERCKTIRENRKL